MQRQEGQHWFEQRERGSRFAISLLAWLALTLGRPFIRVLLYPIAAYYLLAAKQARRASRQFLRRALSREPGWTDVFRHFYTFALVSVDRLFLLSGRYRHFQIDLRGREILEDLASARRGCLVLVSHLGSFDIMRVPGVRDERLPIRILMNRTHNARVVQLMEALDPQLAASVLEAGGAAPALVLALDECLRAGDMVGIMADRAAPGERLVSCRFLGQRTSLPAGPWLLAMTLRVPIVLCFGIYTGGNRYEVHFELLNAEAGTEKIPRKDRERRLATLVEHYVARLEYHARRAPYNWFNFYNFWDDYNFSADETLTDI